jgi:hypothetical protein
VYTIMSTVSWQRSKRNTARITREELIEIRYKLEWIFHSIVYHLFQMIVYQEFSPKFTTLSAV